METMQKEYQLTRDPVFYGSVAFFALLTTTLPAILGQPRLLPLVQAVSLTVLMGLALRRRDVRGALGVVFLWLLVSMLSMLVLTWFAPEPVERAFENGFEYRARFSEWYYASSVLPASFADQPLASLVEIVGILLGSLLTGGLVGAWFLVKMANLAAFGAASLLLTLGGVWMLPIALPLWSIAQLAGAAGLVVLLAEPLLSGRFAAGVANLFGQRRRLLLIFGALYAAGILLEWLLPSFWHFG